MILFNLFWFGFE